MIPSILTIAGTYFSFEPGGRRDWKIETIAHALSHLCRFNGHTRDFYSVAQHCVLASYVVPPEFAFEALMHDRVEAFIGDVSAPLKQFLLDYQRIEKMLEEESAAVFGLPYPMSPEVKRADTAMLFSERRDLMNTAIEHQSWGQSTSGIAPADVSVSPWLPANANLFFMARYRELAEVRLASL